MIESDFLEAMDMTSSLIKYLQEIQAIYPEMEANSHIETAKKILSHLDDMYYEFKEGFLGD